MKKQIQYQFQGKVAFITGAANGIGRSTALMFAEAGGDVAVVDYDKEHGIQTRDLVRSKGVRCEFYQVDMADPSQIQSVVSEVAAHFGQINYAFNNAGIEGKTSPTADASLDNWDKVIDVNLRGVWLCMKHLIPQMLKVGGGSIVNCSSIAGQVGFPGIPAYVASKHGVIGLTKTAALEYVKSNVRVNAICPGVIETPMIDRFVGTSKEARAGLVAGEPMGRMGQPEEIAHAALWLFSEGSSFVTGHALTVDGGWVAQ
jgi:NAD(P)-dependent dehydrogenase (short-subunit alcohol dehydrogenase family)